MGLDNKTKEQILKEIGKHLEEVKHGNIKIKLNEGSGHVDVKVQENKRIYKEKTENKIYNVKNKFHNG